MPRNARQIFSTLFPQTSIFSTSNSDSPCNLLQNEMSIASVRNFLRKIKRNYAFKVILTDFRDHQGNELEKIQNRLAIFNYFSVKACLGHPLWSRPRIRILHFLRRVRNQSMSSEFLQQHEFLRGCTSRKLALAHTAPGLRWLKWGDHHSMGSAIISFYAKRCVLNTVIFAGFWAMGPAWLGPQWSIIFLSVRVFFALFGKCAYTCFFWSFLNSHKIKKGQAGTPFFGISAQFPIQIIGFHAIPLDPVQNWKFCIRCWWLHVPTAP